MPEDMLLFRALWSPVGEGGTEGGSPIAQQYVKNVCLTRNQTVSRTMASGYATCAAAGKHTEPSSVRRITHNGAAIRLTTPTVSTATATATATATGESGSPTDDTAAWYTGTAESVSTAVVAYRKDLAASLEPLPLKGIAGTLADSVPYAVCSGAMGIG